jgi:hypothetical protein
MANHEKHSKAINTAWNSSSAFWGKDADISTETRLDEEG